MSVSVPSFTKTYHTTSYPALDPMQPALSTKGKTVIIACGDVDIAESAFDVASSFAASGASNIALICSVDQALLNAKSKLERRYPSTNVEIYDADLTSTESVGVAAHNIRASFGAWHVFVHNNRDASKNATLAGSDTQDWWSIWEHNIRFTQHFAKHFMPKARSDATYISEFSGAIYAPASHVKGESACIASQAAVLKLNDHLAAEHPNLRVFNVHRDMCGHVRNSDGTLQQWKHDSSVASPELYGDFCVWLLSPEQDFLRGRSIWCNWDIEEMVAMKSEIAASPYSLTPSIGGMPFEQTIVL